MSVYRRGSFWFEVLILLILLTGIIVSFSYYFDARIIPLAVAIPTALFTIAVLVSERYPGLIKGFDVSITDFAKSSEKKLGHGGQGSEGSDKHAPPLKKVAFGYLWICAFFLLIFLIGYNIAVPLFTFLYLKIYWHTGWIKTIIAAIVLGGIIYGTFDVGMRVDLFKGILFNDIVPPL